MNLRTVFSIIFCITTLHVEAAPEFSAVMVQKGPNQKTKTASLYVGQGLMRNESGSGEQQRISIVDTKRNLSWMLNPFKKEFVEFRGPATGGFSRPALPGDPTSPCNKPQGPRCRKIAIESVAGRKAEKWEMTFTQGQQVLRSTIWIDRELGMPIREEMPGGYLRELSSIKLGHQAPKLFRIPAGYKKIALPARNTQ